MAIVLTPDGQFLRVRVPRRGWWPGEEVSWGREPFAYLRPALVLACVLLLLLVPGGLAYQRYWALGPVVAYVSVDINPSLELGIDARERVCVARALNADGEKVLAGLRYRRRSLEKVLSDLTLRAVEHGYLRSGDSGAVLVTVVPVGGPSLLAAPQGEAAPGEPVAGRPGAGPEQRPPESRLSPPRARQPVVDPVRVRDEAVTVATRVLRERGLQVVVKGLAAAPEVREEAIRLNVSPGRLALYLAAREAGMEVTLEQLREGPVVQVLRQAWGRQVKEGKSGGESGTRPDEEPGAASGRDDRGQGRPQLTPAGPGGVGSPPGGKLTPPGHAGAGPGPAVSPSELLEKVWEKSGVEKELPGLMKKFLPPAGKDKEKPAEKGKTEGR